MSIFCICVSQTILVSSDRFMRGGGDGGSAGKKKIVNFMRVKGWGGGGGRGAKVSYSLQFWSFLNSTWRSIIPQRLQFWSFLNSTWRSIIPQRSCGLCAMQSQRRWLDIRITSCCQILYIYVNAKPFICNSLNKYCLNQCSHLFPSSSMSST